MKIRIRKHLVSIFTPLLVCVISTLLLSPIMVSAQETYPGEGKDQLVQALDAAIARVLDSGQWRAIVNSDPAAAQFIINIADCYPRLVDEGDEVYPFPQNPVGALADILASKQIRVGNYDVNDPYVPGTFHVFDTVNPAIMRAIIDELGNGYGIPPYPDPGAIQIVEVVVWPPSSTFMFTKLRDGEFDIIGFNAALGATAHVSGGPEKRRRKLARFTCTVFGTLWYIHVRDDSSYTTFDDVLADPTARLCVGQLSSRLSEDYFKNVRGSRCVPTAGSCTVGADCSTGEICNWQGCVVNNNFGDPCTDNADCSPGETCQPWITKVMTEDDLTECSGGVSDGTYDAYLHFDPVPVSYPDPNDLRVIPMQITSGIPIWVAGEESCDGLDFCVNDLNYDGVVNPGDTNIFFENFPRNVLENPCPACVPGW